MTTKILPMVVVGLTGAVISIRSTMAATHYVDQNHPRASDEDPGTEEQPWKTLSHACQTAGEGDTVWVKSGLYRETLEPRRDRVTFQAFADDAVTIAPPEGRVLDPASWSKVPGRQYVYQCQADTEEKMVRVDGLALQFEQVQGVKVTSDPGSGQRFEKPTVAGKPAGPDATGRPLGGFADGPGEQARFRSPVALACAPQGNLYVADEGNSCVRVVTPEGTVRTLPLPHREPPPGRADWRPPAADHGGAPAPHGVRLLEPAGVAVDPRGRLFVTDAYMHCLLGLDSTGAMGTQDRPPGVLLAGVFHEGIPNSGYGDGTGANCSFAQPVALACAPGGLLYVADFGNNCVRQVTVP